MGVKMSIAFLSVILIPMLLLAYISNRVIEARLLKESQEKLAIGLKAALTEYYVHGDQMRYGMLQAASMEEIKSAVARRDKAYLKKMMRNWHEMRPYVDIWTVVDKDGRVIARLNTDISGDKVDLNGLVQRAVALGEPQTATEVIHQDLLRREGNELRQKMRLRDVQEGNKPADVLALMVVTPVQDAERRTIGAIITGDAINNDVYIPDTVAYKLPGMFTTITYKGTRIATNLTDGAGRQLTGTNLPIEALKLISSGKSAFMELNMPDTTFISMFEPIRDAKGGIIGSIDVGMSKDKLWAIQRQTQTVIAAITVLGIVMSLIAAMFLTNRITRPLKSLKEKLGNYKDWSAAARLDVSGGKDAKDEIASLAVTFNSMLDEVLKREEEKASYLNEIEQKNREYAQVNDELKKTNEELEVAYEETQSQTEELHSINEELRILNEDLDKRNSELKAANNVIKREEEELKKTKDKLRLIYDGIQDHVLLVDYDRRIMEANRHFMRAFGADEQMILGKDVCAFFGMGEPRDGCPVKKAIDAAVPFEVEITAPNGKVLMWHTFPLIAAGGAQKMAVVYIKDVTNERMLTQKLMQSDKLSSLGELVSGVAHELNNPLTGIMCFTELMMMEAGEGTQIRDRLSKVYDASHRCKKIIDNLLTFARWKKPEKKYDDINRVLKGIVDLRAYQLKVDDIALTLDLDERLPFTMLDEHQIHQVILNLINNARDAIMDAGRHGTIKIRTRRGALNIVITVEDNGRGMTSEVASRIFDPFFTTKPVGRGTGLGLSISYGIINEHGGNIRVASTLEAGTTFIIELPITENTTGGGEADKTKPSSDTARQTEVGDRALKALILDDEAIILDLLNDTLKQAGFVVDRCSSGEDALTRIAAVNYDIIISDIKMPGMDGKRFYHETGKIKPELLNRFIFITGDGVNKDTQEFLKGTQNAFLKKPFTIDQLTETVEKLIKQTGDKDA